MSLAYILFVTLVGSLSYICRAGYFEQSNFEMNPYQFNSILQ